MKINKIDDELVDYAVEKYFNGEHLISLEKQGSIYIIVTKMLPISN